MSVPANFWSHEYNLNASHLLNLKKTERMIFKIEDLKKKK